MISKRELVELRSVLQVQKLTLSRMDKAVTQLEQRFEVVDELSAELAELESMMAELESLEEWIEPSDFEDFDLDAVFDLYQQRHKAVTDDLQVIGYQNWEQFVRACQTQALHEGLDPLAPYNIMLSQAELERLRQEGDTREFAWDRLDITFVCVSGILAAMTDFLLVRIPQTPKGVFVEQQGSVLTGWLKQYDIKDKKDWVQRWLKELEARCKVPYDAQHGICNFKGLCGNTHRLQSLGHDPVLGFVFGVLDILRGTITGFSYDKGIGHHTFASVRIPSESISINLIEAILLQLGHLLSDVATPAGLPAPLFGLLQRFNVGSFQFGDKKERTLAEVARWMYLNGYDLRHFLVSGIMPAVVEIVLRGYLMLRHYAEKGSTEFDAESHHKIRTMLLAAHGVAAAANAGKVILYQGNPLAVNYAEWLALLRYLVPSLKHWLFDRDRLHLEQMETLTDSTWNELLANSQTLMEKVYAADDNVFRIGALADQST
ncbi:MAG: hypothetical protein AAF704_18305 [Cyanobacteria bacterium P01_D01_bin.123]